MKKSKNILVTYTTNYMNAVLKEEILMKVPRKQFKNKKHRRILHDHVGRMIELARKDGKSSPFTFLEIN